jgi:2-C-methyl-D-erythritol 2,4-cyclodiphosphate synthase|tara:strand:+ start:196 stop:690 length:495 start_codon:yes stop_codon:yes gene_type:complete
MIKTGIGYDVHKLKEGMPLIIGGVMIESSLGSVGHSDGDGLIHAICDSLLGASGIGDIGTFFPSDNKKWENAESRLFLTEVNKMVLQAGYYISNIDCTIVLQKPKLSSYIVDIKKNIANILNVNQNNISIKATTTDHLGYIGESKGWSVIAISTIYSTNEKNSY